jgi:hypothetical protein
MRQCLPIQLSLGNRPRCASAELASCRQPVIHTVYVTRRADDDLGRLSGWASDRYLDHCRDPLKAETCPAMLIDVLA